MFLIIGVWGGKRRVYAAFKFFLYTLTGSLLMLLGIMAMYWTAHTSDIEVLLRTHFSPNMQFWLWLAFFASFAVKMPMWPVHTWLPDAHVEAPTAGSVILAGILLKMGGYGFLRFSLPMFPDASVYFAPMVFALSVIAIIYTSLVALVQEDMKKLIAYSSVAHMGFVTMGLFSGNTQGVQGAVFQMVSHGLVSGALFLCVGVVYDRLHTREIAAYGGLVNRMPRYAVADAGVHDGECRPAGHVRLRRRVPNPARRASRPTPGLALFATTGVILSAAYALYLYRRVIFGVLEKPALLGIQDVTFPRAAHLDSAAAADPLLRRPPAADPQRERSFGRADIAGRAACGAPPSTRPGFDAAETADDFHRVLASGGAAGVPALALGVLGLILVGALRGERSVWLVTEIAVALLGVALHDRPVRQARPRASRSTARSPTTASPDS